MNRTVPLVFSLLLSLAIFPPFVSLAGPLSLDDVLPLLAMLWAFAVLPFRSTDLKFDAAVVGFVALALISLVSNAANAETVADFLRLSGRSTGRLIYYQALLLGARAILSQGNWARHALVLVVCAATLESLFCIYAYWVKYKGPYGLGVITFADWSVLAGRHRVQGTFSGEQLKYETAAVSPNFLAAYLVMLIPTTLGLIWVVKQWPKRVALLMSVLLQTVTLYLTYTRAALIAFGFSILAMGFLAGKRKVAVLLFLSGLVATLAIPSVRTKLLGETHDRWALYWASAHLTSDHPLTGVGDGNYDDVLHQNQKYFDTPYGIAATTSHNSVLLSGANYGLLGGGAHALLYVLLIAVVLHEVHRTRDSKCKVLAAGIGAGLLGYLVQDQFNNLAYVPKVATQMWLLYAILPLIARREAEQEAAKAALPACRAPVVHGNKLCA